MSSVSAMIFDADWLSTILNCEGLISEDDDLGHDLEEPNPM